MGSNPKKISQKSSKKTFFRQNFDIRKKIRRRRIFFLLTFQKSENFTDFKIQLFQKKSRLLTLIKLFFVFELKAAVLLP